MTQFILQSLIVFLLGLFFVVPYLLRMVDETSAAFDPGILHSIVVVCIVYSIFQVCTWSIVKTIWPDIGRYFRLYFSSEFYGVNKELRIKIALGIYFIILLSFVLLTCAIV